MAEQITQDLAVQILNDFTALGETAQNTLQSYLDGGGVVTRQVQHLTESMRLVSSQVKVMVDTVGFIPDGAAPDASFILDL